MSSVRQIVFGAMRAPEYEDAKRIARIGSAEERTAMAERSDMAPELLFYLSADSESTVRLAVARNQATPPQADHMLACDKNEDVRVCLARKIATLVPSLDPQSHDKLEQLTWETLTRLVEDTAIRVRAAVADVVKDMDEVPRSLVLKLAQDVEIPVAGPVLALSPLLTNDDLIALVNAPPGAETVAAIARRPHLNETVSDAIAASASSSAITALLRNGSAHIREQTLDALIARAADQIAWHEPLVRRPSLSGRAARALAGIVAEHLVRALAARPDLDPATADLLRRQLVKQISWGTPSAPHPSDNPSPMEALATAQAIDQRGELTEDRLLTIAARGDVRMVAVLLARAADVALSVVERAASLRSAKGLVALCWRAGFSMRLGGVVQALLGRLPPGSMLAPSPNGNWPMTDEEMRWQIAFLSRPGRNA